MLSLLRFHVLGFSFERREFAQLELTRLLFFVGREG